MSPLRLGSVEEIQRRERLKEHIDKCDVEKTSATLRGRLDKT